MPNLSIIITAYNYTHMLPRLFANIEEQGLSDYEIVVVDDCSEVSPEAVVKQWRDKGLNIVLIRNESRQYTKNTRLIGVEGSSGRLITFIDADDVFFRKQALAYHVEQQRQLDVDILQFNSIHYEDGKPSKREFPWAQPFAERLDGEDIFRTYVRSWLPGHTIWGKIIKRELWEQCLAPARASSVRRYGEDLFLSSLLFFHARSYAGSSRIGYAREWKDKVAQKSLGRAVTQYALLTEFVPYIAERGADEETARGLQHFFLYHLHQYVQLFFASHSRQFHPLLPDDFFLALHEHGDAELLLRAVVTGILAADTIENSSEASQKTFSASTGSDASKPFFYDNKPSREMIDTLKAWYQSTTGKSLNLDSPKTFNEKIQWLKLYDSTRQKSLLTDKVTVRAWIEKKIGDQYLVPLLGVWNSFDEIDFDLLPDRFALKTNHGSGYIIVVKNKAQLDKKDAKKKFDRWLATNFASNGFQMHYAPIKPRIFAEQFIENHDECILDYRFLCFNGAPKAICVDHTVKGKTLNRNLYDRDWERIPYRMSFPPIDFPIEPPKNFEKMREFARILCEGFLFVRVDFYEIDGKLYFSEMTFTPGNGTGLWDNEAGNLLLGSMLELPCDKK